MAGECGTFGWFVGGRLAVRRAHGVQAELEPKHLERADDEVEFDARLSPFHKRDPLPGHADPVCKIGLRPSCRPARIANERAKIVGSPQEHSSPPGLRGVDERSQV